MIAIATSVLGLAACGAGDSSGERSMTDVPDVVRKIMATEFLGDGQIHVQSSGAFKVEPNTLFCEMEASLDPEIRKLGILGMGIDGVKLSAVFKGLGQSDFLHGSPRQRPIRSGECSNDGSNVIYQGYAKRNSAGTPYKLTLAVWQGDPTKGGAVWVGGVERLNGRRLDVVTGAPSPMGGPPTTQQQMAGHIAELSIGHDAKDLTDLFLDEVLRDGGGQ